jgi:hypothetical protein
MRNQLLRGSALAAILAASLSAQSLLPVGSSVGGGDDSNVAITLPFTITFPDGTVTDMINVDTNGRITPASFGVGPDFGESVFDLLSFPQFCAYWDDQNDSVGADDQIYLDTSVPGVATITHLDTEEWPSSPPFTYQIQFSNTGTITFVWDARTADPGIDGDCIVGVSDGGGVDPGEVDFSGVFSGTISGGTTIYEQFGLGEFDLADGVLAETGLVFTPTMTGYDVTGIVPPPPLPSADVVEGRQACENAPAAGSTDFVLTPTSPGYVLSTGGAFDAGYAAGTEFPTPGDDAKVTLPMLPFLFTLPGGTATDMLEATSNGRILQGGTTEGADFSPTSAEFLNDAVAQIAVLWTDLNLSSFSGAGSIWYNDNTTNVSVTWENCVEFGVPGSSNTFQCILRNDSSIEIHLQDVALTNAGFSGSEAIIGVSPGNMATGSSTDFSTLPFSATDVLFEEFATVADYDFDDRSQDVALTADIFAATFPVLGTNFDVDTADSTGTATAVVYFFGLPATPGIDLGILDPGLAGCEVYADIATPGFVVAAPTGVPGTPTTVIAIPNDPALAGVTGLVVSGLVINPGTLPALFPTDELVLTLGV